MELIHDFSPIPKIFWSFESGKAFRHCSICDCDLMVRGTNYLIEKAFKKQETIFEYAMCYACYQKLQETLSINSRKLIDHYFDEHVDFEKRRCDLMAKYGRRTDSWINRCMITGRRRSQCDEHQIYGWFIDSDIAFTGMPYMLSGQVIDEILKLLSEETTGVIEDLSNRLFGVGQPQGTLLI